MSSRLDERIDTLSQEIDILAKECQNNEDTRKKLLGSIMHGMTKIELPTETIWRLMFNVSLLRYCQLYHSLYIIAHPEFCSDDSRQSGTAAATCQQQRATNS